MPEIIRDSQERGRSRAYFDSLRMQCDVELEVRKNGTAPEGIYRFIPKDPNDRDTLQKMQKILSKLTGEGNISITEPQPSLEVRFNNYTDFVFFACEMDKHPTHSPAGLNVPDQEDVADMWRNMTKHGICAKRLYITEQPQHTAGVARQ